jgi:hypothetical protein
MGLLDDAIREHLELRRRHGADPGEVARQEHEALGRVRRGEAAAEEEGGAVAAGLSVEAVPREPPVEEPEPRDEPEPEPSEPVGEPEAPVAPPAPSDERDGEPAGAEALGLDAPPEPAAPPEPPAELEPDEPVRRAPEADRPAPDDEAAGEDVLEETPEFLQETPEHDRLWFEQKPPRDFEF